MKLNSLFASLIDTMTYPIKYYTNSSVFVHYMSCQWDFLDTIVFPVKETIFFIYGIRILHN